MFGSFAYRVVSLRQTLATTTRMGERTLEETVNYTARCFQVKVVCATICSSRLNTHVGMFRATGGQLRHALRPRAARMMHQQPLSVNRNRCASRCQSAEYHTQLLLRAAFSLLRMCSLFAESDHLLFHQERHDCHVQEGRFL